MSRYRLLPSTIQEAMLREHCAHARYVWNLAVEQHSHWRPGRKGAPGYLEQSRQRAPTLTVRERKRIVRLKRKLARAKRGSNRRKQVRLGIARLLARETDRRKDWAEKASTDIARRFDVIRVEDLRIRNMTRSARGTADTPGRNVRQKAGLNREILRSGWGLLVRRLEEKAPGRVEKINPHYTSQRCSACRHVDAESRESQARFVCTVCGFTLNADVNAARNIAAGHAVNARGGVRDAGPVNREPHLLASLPDVSSWNPRLWGGCQSSP
jgi:transposase